MPNEDKMNAGAPALEMPEALAARGIFENEVNTLRAESASLRAKK